MKDREEVKPMDCIEGEFYRINHESGISLYLISRFSGTHDGHQRFESSYYISNMNGNWKFDKSTPYYGSRKIYKATHSERIWLEKCIKANAFVEADTVFVEPYNIYNYG